MTSYSSSPFQHHMTKSQFRRICGGDAFEDSVRTIADIDEGKFSAMVDRLREVTGFLGGKRLSQLVGNELGDSEQTDAVVSTLTNFASLRKLASGAFDFDLDAPALMTAAIAKAEPAIATDAAKRVVTLLGPFEPIDRSAKAEDVAGRTAMSLHDIDFISDLRPVFGDDREEVLACVPITTVKLQLDGPEVFPKTVHLQVTESQLIALCDRAAQALRKLGALKKTLKEASIDLPETSWTEEDTPK